MPERTNKDLVDKFLLSAVDTVATVEKIDRTPEALNKALLREIADEQFVLLSQPGDIDEELFAIFVQNEKVITNPTGEQLKTIKTGITDSFCAVAKTGSVCVSINEYLTSPISMLTRKHIVVVDSCTIVPRPLDVFSENYLEGKGLSKSFSFITGPSATADMGPLVRGVHGPGQIHIIVLD
ncbi:MAG: LUD domain-containing protein [Bacteroidota bacterium]